MKQKNIIKKSIILVSTLVALILCMSLTVLAFDLPIDPEEINRQRTERQPALTSRHGIDLFSETSSEINNDITERRLDLRTDAQSAIFNYPHNIDIIAPENSIRQAVQENRLFSEPVRFDRGIQNETNNDEIPLWTIVIVIIAAVAVGMLIAIKTTSRGKVKAKNVHHHNA